MQQPCVEFVNPITTLLNPSFNSYPTENEYFCDMLNKLILRHAAMIIASVDSMATAQEFSTKSSVFSTR